MWAVQSDQSKRYRETLRLSGLAREADRAALQYRAVSRHLDGRARPPAGAAGSDGQVGLCAILGGLVWGEEEASADQCARREPGQERHVSRRAGHWPLPHPGHWLLRIADSARYWPQEATANPPEERRGVRLRRLV